MDAERHQRMKFLLRKNAGEKKRPTYQEKLSKILGREQANVSFLPLEQSDPVRERFLDEVKRNEEAQSPSSVKMNRASWDELENDLLKIRELASDKKLYVFLPEADCVGAFPLGERDFLFYAVNLYREFNESVYAVDSADNSYGILIDYFDDFYHGVKNFDAIFYGGARALLRSLAQRDSRSCPIHEAGSIASQK